MEISNNGIKFIKNEEEFVGEPYLDAVGVPTIGYGSTVYEDGSRVRLTDKPVTIARATKLLLITLKGYENAVTAAIHTVINQNQFDALVSFAYNVGNAGMAGSTLVRKINASTTDPSITYWFSVWNKGTINGKKVVLPGLVARRKREAELYFKA